MNGRHHNVIRNNAESSPLIRSDVESNRTRHRSSRRYFFKETAEWIKNVGRDFKAFIDKGSVVSLAVGIVIGEAFSAVVTSFVSDMVTPVLGLFITSKLSETFLVIREGPNYPYKTRDEARKDGAITWNYGNTLQLAINFFIISLCLFVVVRMLQSMRRKKIESSMVKLCPYCFQDVDGRATRCAHCTASIDGVRGLPPIIESTDE